MKKSPCDKCDGRCCSYSDILLEEDERFLYISKDRPNILGKYLVLPMMGGKCPYLKGNKCSIYDNRPKSCRTFECVYGYKKKKGRKILTTFLQDNPDIVELIEREKPK